MFLTVQEAADHLKVSCATVYALISKKHLNCHRIGTGRGVIRISLENIATFLKQAESKAAAEPAPQVPQPRLKHIKL
ncbi:helix-turn-helix domain-containing protein [Fuerstiella marisgermanici]|uniref:DNA binding domain, excisionase family n=1 Tax=Fuerstiella marisgermanici TaxID=1891926 RepID=A0A1P8WHB2_9PLAN|nr:DNA binding domain, excisionase family [Fuerstiella marisgermanici]